jgi:hypothetical protein
MSLSAEQRRALELLATGARGCTKRRLLADGFTVDMLTDLVREGLATAQRDTMRVAAERSGSNATALQTPAGWRSKSEAVTAPTRNNAAL